MKIRNLEQNIELANAQRLYEVVVVGGGIAGVSAALAAARLGRRVCLVEKMYALGGLATLGLVTIYLPLCDGSGNQVSYGISEELLRLSIKHGWERDYPDEWLGNNDVCILESSHERKQNRKYKQRFQVRFNAQVFSILMEQLLCQECVTILYGAHVTDLCMEKGKIKKVIAEGKEGRFELGCTAVVDASGDADICQKSGTKTAIYERRNPLAAWYYETFEGSTKLNMLGAADKLVEEEGKENPQPLKAMRISGLDTQETSQMMIRSRKEILDHFLKKGSVSEKHSLTAFANLPQVRMTRRLSGVYTASEKDLHQFFPDSIGMIGDWRKRGPVYEIPFRVLYGQEVKNLLVAGRCISTTDEMWDITRAIPACAVTGQAAGTAAALSDDMWCLDIELLQQKLHEGGVKLHESELVKA